MTSPPPAELPSTEPVVRVGLAVDTAEVAIGGTTTLSLFDAQGSRSIGSLPVGATAIVRAAGGTLRTDALDLMGLTTILARPTGDGFLVVDGKVYRGELRITASGGSTLTAVNRLPMELYLLGVVPYEIGRVGPELLEASKAQAVAARTYALRYLGRREALGFDVFATVADQVYGGAEGEHGPVSDAVLATRGEVLTYDGRLIEAFYHSTCSGRTAAIEEVWPEERPRPYLVSITDLDPVTGEAFDKVSSRFAWSQRWTADQINTILGRTLADSLPAGVSSVGRLQDIHILDMTPSGRIARMRITTENGSFMVGRDRIRWIFMTPEDRILNSSMFQVDLERDTAGQITAVVANGGGWGHGIGMCQVGAMGRARAGQDYRTILGAYYPGTEIRRPY